jgi:hypothetical protein
VHDLEFSQVEMQVSRQNSEEHFSICSSIFINLDFILTKVLDSLKAGNESLKAVHKLFSIEDIEMIMEETREGIDKQKVIFHTFFFINCYFYYF